MAIKRKEENSGILRPSVVNNTEERLYVLLRTRAELASKEKEVKAAIEEIKEEAIPLMVAEGITTFQDEMVGTLSLVEGVNKSISQDRLRESLLKYLDAADVAEILDRSTTVTRYTTIQYKKPKG